MITPSARLLRLAAGALVLAAALLGGGTARAEDQTARCAGLRDLYLDATDLLSAAPVAASADLPAFCRVLGFVRPAIHFELRLPVDGWNGKLYMVGCGGFCGNLDADLPGFLNAMNFGLRRGYAAVATDGGHWGADRASGLWGLDNRQAEIDWGYRAVGEVARVAKAAVAAYYGRAPAHAYFVGCGTGGRMAAIAAQRYPDAFDGIISGDPFLHQTDVMGVLYAWQAQTLETDGGGALFDDRAIQMLTQGALAACDGADGLQDGLIAEPWRCLFDPARLRCRGSEKTCLSPPQVEAAPRLYAGASDEAGDRLTHGLAPGSERFWPFWVTGEGARQGVNLLFGREFLRYLAYDPDPGEAYDPATFDFDQDPPALEGARGLYDATDPDLGPFRARGGKLIMYHGAADAAVPVQYSIDYFEAVAARQGGWQGTQGFFRLFVVPGMDHCAIEPGAGPDQFDPLSALEDWVERGRPPDSLPATQPARDGAPARSRPLCPYPLTARLTPGTDPDRAESFVCAAP
ncbi:MAG: tannase/feruloyl esterase family alpha/beta hydrolase [Rhodospirillaceae bacterium]|nr:tannase/feruloyl esterase family alpha/beta hydrolase [Rhodospirillaceae bacterium]